MVASVVAKLDFRIAAEEGRLHGAVGQLLRLDGFGGTVPGWMALNPLSALRRSATPNLHLSPKNSGKGPQLNHTDGYS